MTKYLSLPLLSLILFTSSCANQNKHEIEVSSFSQCGTLHAVIRPIPVPILLPRYMGILDNYLFVYKERERNLFTLFHLNDGTYIQDGGMRGQGPNEFNLLDTRSFNTEADCFSVLEVGSNQLKTVKYDGSELTTVHSKTIFEQGISNNGFYLLADSMYLTLGRLGENNEYCLLNGRTGELIEKGEYPQWTNISRKADTPPLFVTYLKTCVVHPDKKKFAAFYGRFKRIRIYDSNINLLQDIDVKVSPYFTKFEEQVQNQPIYYIGQPFATEHHIYALCVNSNTGIEQYELQIWDWDGHPVGCYQFDRKLSMMAVSLKYKKIYALDSNIENELYIYDLPLLE